MHLQGCDSEMLLTTLNLDFFLCCCFLKIIDNNDETTF